MWEVNEREVRVSEKSIVRSIPTTLSVENFLEKRQAKLLVSRRHAFFTKICVSPAGRVCVYSSLILSTFFLRFSAPV